MLTKKHSNVNKTKQNTELHGVAARGGQLVAAVIVVREPYGTQRFPEFDAAPAFIQFDDRRLAGLYFDAIVCCDDIKDGETDGIYQLLVPFLENVIYERERGRNGNNKNRKKICGIESKSIKFEMAQLQLDDPAKILPQVFEVVVSNLFFKV